MEIQALIWKLCLLVLSMMLTSCLGNDVWTQKKKNHKSRMLPKEKMKRWMTERPTDNNQFKSLLKPLLTERVSGTPQNKKVQDYLKKIMGNLKWTIRTDEFEDETPLGTKQFTNIIADQDPDALRKLTIACHFDSKYFKDGGFIGATDSAVPCAMMLDLATHLNNQLFDVNKKMKDISLQFLFFDGEEAFESWHGTDNTYGARHLAPILESEKVKVDREYYTTRLGVMDCLILLDLIGYKNPIFKSWFEDTHSLYKRLQNIEGRLQKADLLPGKTNTYFPSTQPHQGRSGIEDDHVPFMNRDVPILHLITTPFPKTWHTKDDNEKNIDYVSVEHLNKILRVFVTEYLHLSVK